MPEQRIIVEIDDTGKINAKTDGFKGEICLTELQELLAEIADVESISKTDEYYQQVEVHTQNVQTVGRRS